MRSGLNLYLNPSEKTMLKDKAQKAGITQSAYLRTLLSNEHYYQQNEVLELLTYINQDLLMHLDKIGNNINQIAYVLNSGMSKDSQSILKELNELKTLLKEHKLFINNQVKAKILKKAKK